MGNSGQIKCTKKNLTTLEFFQTLHISSTPQAMKFTHLQLYGFVVMVSINSDFFNFLSYLVIQRVP